MNKKILFIVYAIIVLWTVSGALAGVYRSYFNYYEDFDNVVTGNFTSGAVGTSYKYNTTNGLQAVQNSDALDQTIPKYQNFTKSVNFNYTSNISIFLSMMTKTSSGNVDSKPGLTFFNATASTNRPAMMVTNNPNDASYFVMQLGSTTQYYPYTAIAGCSFDASTWYKLLINVTSLVNGSSKAEVQYQSATNTYICGGNFTFDIPTWNNAEGFAFGIKDGYGSSSPGVIAMDEVNFRIDGVVNPVTPVNNFTVTAKDLFGANINNFTVDIGGYNITTTSGTATTSVLQNATSLYTLKIFNAINNYGSLFNVTYSNVNVSSNFQGNLSQTDIKFTAKERETNNTLNGFFFNNTGGIVYNTSTGTGFNYYPGLLGVNFNDNAGMGYTCYEILNLTALMNTTLPLYNCYDALVQINVLNAFTLLDVNYTANYTNLNTGYKQKTVYSDGVSIVTEEIRNNNYTFFIDAPGYAISGDNYLNYTPTGSYQEINFTVYTNNSVRIKIYDIATNTLINENISITFSGPGGDTNVFTTNGSYYIDNLTDGNYSVTFLSVAGNYSTSVYLITVADRSTQLLNAYLTANAQQTIFTIQDSSSGQLLEGASIQQNKLVNGSYILIESKLSDISGRAQFNYLPGGSYRFTVSKNSYQTKLFDLNPILFATYTVNLDRTTAQNQTAQYSDVQISYNPKKVNAYANNSVIVLISSPNGVLKNYLFRLYYLGNKSQYTGANSYGAYVNLTINLTNATFSDNVALYLEYNTTLGNRFNFTYYLPIEGGYTGTNTFKQILQADYGLGWLERVLIATGIIIIVAGLVFLIAGGLPALLMGLMLMGFFMYINFIPLWGLLIAVFVGIILLSRQQGA